jgi:hypothetical protein
MSKKEIKWEINSVCVREREREVREKGRKHGGRGGSGINKVKYKNKSEGEIN